MTRLEKKCLVGAAGMHGLLVGILLVSAAFQGPPPAKPDGIPLATIISANVLDRIGVGGGTPTPTPPAPKPEAAQQQAPAPQKQPVRTPPKPQDTPKADPTPEPPKPTKHVDREIDLSTDQPINNDGPKVHTPKKGPRVKLPKDINVDLYNTTSVKTGHKPKHPTTQSSDSESDVAYNDNLSSAISKIGSKAMKGIGSKTSGITQIGDLGSGGGAAFTGYENIIFTKYYHAWTPPDGISDSTSYTDVEIVVARDGTIISANIIAKSGKSAMDKSVSSALRKVTRLPPFPEGAQDSQRTFQIRFNLDAKQSAG